jgi:malate synthase
MIAAGTASERASRVEVLPGVTLPESAWETASEVVQRPALALAAALHRDFEPSRRQLLDDRAARQARWDGGALPGRPAHPEADRIAGDWRVAAIPADLLRRRVEITGPVSDAKMVINMLSRNAAGERADCAMLDFEDSMMPAWGNVVAGFRNLAAAARGSLRFEQPAGDGRPAKRYSLDPEDMPVVMVRCRGLHLDEANVEIDGEPIAAGLLELAVAASSTAEVLLERQRTPKFYVPKVEHWREARWWHELMSALEGRLGLDAGALRVTFLIETLPAAFQVEEILWELRQRVTALNVGRWDKIFSDIKVLKEHPDRILADRATITMQRPWMRDYAATLIRACHRHGAWAMGGMAAFTPGRTEERRAEQTARVEADKAWEAGLGHDGCWVSHPYFIGPAMAAFRSDAQLDLVPPLDADASLLPAGGGPYTEAGLRTNVRVGIAYLEGWRRGIGCVAWDDLMEDLATLEISRAQTWQWLRHGVALADGRPVDRRLVAAVFAEELERIRGEIDDAERRHSFERAAEAAERLFCEGAFRPFLATSSQAAVVATEA